MARRIATNVGSNGVGSPLAEIATKVEEDFLSLERLMRELEIEPSRTKDVLSQLGERLSRLKPNGRIGGRSRLSDVLELEMLVVGITGKQALWESLRFVPSVSHTELDELIERAEQQKATVEECRQEAAGRTFGGSSGSPSATARS